MNILIRPIITEKMTKLGEKLNRYGFVVDRRANKIQIRNAVEKMYGVNVTSVNTIVIPGKQRTRYTRTGLTKGQKSAYKKAIVTLNTGETIDFYSNV
ncbi:MAG TPA: 50S ribosomal protein L23 [Chitinophagales bacterium]|nr:50S ribosomal protein L23 [Chitinophagales bacterium]